MSADNIEVWITGIGLVSSLGEGLDNHWDALQSGTVNVDKENFAPYFVHPMAPLNFDKQVPRKDLRQMEAWQRIGTYAAGLALDSAGIKGNTDILGRTDMIVAAGGGERDLAVDNAILGPKVQGNLPATFLNERLMNDLRPKLLLSQLSNLLAGNISIVHGVVGSSRTFMGEESAGVDAVRIALARIASGQSDIALVGAAQNSERKEQLLLYELGGFNLKHKFASVWAREANPGFALGSCGVFLVIESRKHAEARGAKPYARLSRVVADRAQRDGDGKIEAVLARMWHDLDVEAGGLAVITGATGAEPATREERKFLGRHETTAIRATGTRFGNTMEVQFPLGLALAALSISKGALFPPDGMSDIEVAMTRSPTQIVVVTTSHWRGEGMGLVEAAG